MTRVVLLGDSHLARLRRDLARLGDGEVVNAAEGGGFASDLLPQARRVEVGASDVVVVSVGTNDAAPWKQVPLERVLGEVRAFLAEVPVDRLVYVLPPGVDEARLTGVGDRTQELLAGYGQAISELLAERRAVIVDTPALLADVGPDAFADDGLHLSGLGYGALVPALRDAIAAAVGDATPVPAAVGGDVVRAACDRADALAAADPARLTALLHPDFRWTSHLGRVFDRAEYVEANTGGGTVWRAQTLEDPEVVVVGDAAVLRAVADDEVVGPEGPVHHRMPVTQVWVRSGEGWRCLAGHAGPRLDG